MKKMLLAAIFLIAGTVALGQNAPITFQVVDSTFAETDVELKGSWVKATGVYDSGWDGGAVQQMYDDGTNGDATASDNIWTLIVDLVPDGGANTWQWGAQNGDGAWLIEGPNPEFTVTDATPQTLTYVIPPIEGVTATITFQADMTDMINLEGFNDTDHTIEVRGGFNGWAGGDALAPDLLDPTLYTLDVDITEVAGTDIEWKFHATPDSLWNNNGWETAANRVFTFDGTNQVLDVAAPVIIAAGQPLTADATLEFSIEWIDGTLNANTEEAFPVAPDTIVVNGTFNGGWFTWGDCMTGCEAPAGSEMARLTDTDADGIYTGTLVLATGHSNLITWKMGAHYPGIDSLAAVSPNGAIDNEAGFGTDRVTRIPVDGGAVPIVDKFGSNNPDNPWLQLALITFTVVDSTFSETDIELKGSWNKTTGEYDSGWDGGAVQQMYDDGTNGDATSGDNIWTLAVDLVPDGGANTWQWGAQNGDGAWLIEGPNPEFTVVDATPQALSYTIPPIAGVTATITFQADMTDMINLEGFNDTDHTIEVRGGFNGWAGGDVLAADLLDPTLYTLALDITEEAGTDIEWKFHATPDSAWNNNGWETAANRTFTFDGTDITLDATAPVIIAAGQPLTADATLEFSIAWLEGTLNANTDAAFAATPDTIVVNGTFNGGWFTWGDCMSGCEAPAGSEMPRLTDDNSDGIYTGSLVLASGHTNLMTWKMGAHYPGIDSLAYVSSNGAIDNEAGFGTDRVTRIPVTGGIVAVVDTFGSNNVNNPWLGIHQVGAYLPEKFALLGNYPNPFNPETQILFELDMTADVTVAVYDLLGRQVSILHQAMSQPGRYSIGWQGRDQVGRSVPSGVYIYRITANRRVLTGKMLLLK